MSALVAARPRPEEAPVITTVDCCAVGFGELLFRSAGRTASAASAVAQVVCRECFLFSLVQSMPAVEAARCACRRLDRCGEATARGIGGAACMQVTGILWS